MAVNSFTRARGVLRAAFPLLFLATGGSAMADAILLSDTFTAPDNTALPGRAPDTVNTPGGTYAANGGSGYTNSISGGMAQLAVDEGAGVPTGVTTPTVYTLSDTFNNGTIGGNDQADRGTGFGFFSSLASGANGFHGDSNFTGITVSPSGVINLISVTADQTITTYSTFSLNSFDNTVNHTLSYSADTTTGGISNVMLDGSAIPLTSFPGVFTPLNTAYAGFTASANALGESASYDNFVVSTTTPEPASPGLIGMACLGLAGRKRRADDRI